MKAFVCRWYWWLPALLVAAGVGYVAYRAMHPPWEGTEVWEKYEQIRLGMTFRDALAVFGGRKPAAVTTYDWSARWDIDDDCVGVEIDGGGRVFDKWARIRGQEFSEPSYGSWWARWRARLGR